MENNNLKEKLSREDLIKIYNKSIQVFDRTEFIRRVYKELDTLEANIINLISYCELNKEKKYHLVIKKSNFPTISIMRTLSNKQIDIIKKYYDDFPNMIIDLYELKISEFNTYENKGKWLDIYMQNTKKELINKYPNQDINDIADEYIRSKENYINNAYLDIFMIMKENKILKTENAVNIDIKEHNEKNKHRKMPSMHDSGVKISILNETIDKAIKYIKKSNSNTSDKEDREIYVNLVLDILKAWTNSLKGKEDSRYKAIYNVLNCESLHNNKIDTLFNSIAHLSFAIFRMNKNKKEAIFNIINFFVINKATNKNEYKKNVKLLCTAKTYNKRLMDARTFEKYFLKKITDKRA